METLNITLYPCCLIKPVSLTLKNKTKVIVRECFYLASFGNGSIYLYRESDNVYTILDSLESLFDSLYNHFMPTPTPILETNPDGSYTTRYPLVYSAWVPKAFR